MLNRFLYALIFFAMISGTSCKQGDNQQPNAGQLTVNSNQSLPSNKRSPQEENTGKVIPYDLGTINKFNQSVDQYGRTVKEVYSLPDGKQIAISYDWEGGTFRCTGAKAVINGQILAQAKVIGIERDKANRPYQEVEETHYAVDGSRKVKYKARSQFQVSLSASKIAESRVEGEKLHELFTHWGRFNPGGSPY